MCATPLAQSRRLPVGLANVRLGSKRWLLGGAQVGESQWMPVERGDAAECGHLEVLQWARANGCLWNDMTCANAAKGGHPDTLKWLRAGGCPWDYVISRCR
jgi:hypothetical protein